MPLPSDDKHSRRSIAEIADTVPPLSARPRMGQGKGRKMLIATHSDAADSAVSMVSVCVDKVYRKYLILYCFTSSLSYPTLPLLPYPPVI